MSYIFVKAKVYDFFMKEAKKKKKLA